MTNRLTSRVGVLLLLLVVLGLYYPLISAPVNSLDDPGMYSYLLNADHFSFREIFLPGSSGTYYRPLLLVSFLGDKYLWGLEESFMHLENLLFHLANCLLLYAVARRAGELLRVASPWPPFLAALLFAIHPINTESIDWISGRTDLLAGFFLLLSVYLLLRRPGSVGASTAGAVSLLLACLAKDTAIFLLPALLLLPFFLPSPDENHPTLRQTTVRYLPHLLVFSAAAAAYFAFRELAFKQGDLGARQVLTHVVGGQRDGLILTLRLVLKAAGFYVKKLFMPFPLNFAIVHVSDFYIVIGLLLGVLLLWLLTRRTLAAFFFLAAAAIGSSALLVPLLKMTWTPLAERYMYIPSGFFLVGITFSVARWRLLARYQRLFGCGVAALILVAVWGTAQRNFLWQDNLALYRDTVRKSPDFTPARNQLAIALFAKGKNKEADTIITSIQLPKDLINRQYGLISKATVLLNNGDYTGARILLNQALTDPGKHEVAILELLLNTDKLQLMAKKATPKELYPGSVKTLSRLIELTNDPFYSYRLGIVNMQVGEREKALTAFNTVVCTASPTAYYLKPAEKLVEKLGK